jgi:hypothetical protein
MSIAAMVDNEVAKSQRQPPVTAIKATAARAEEGTEKDTPSRTSDVVSALVSYVPAEAIAAYVAVLPFMDPSSADKSSTGGTDAAAHYSYLGRWGLAGVVAVLAIGYAVGYRAIAAKQARRSFKFPWIPVATTFLAFAAWVFAIPNSPFNEFDFYTPELGAAIGTIFATAISFVAAVTGETLTWAQAKTETETPTVPPTAPPTAPAPDPAAG